MEADNAKEKSTIALMEEEVLARWEKEKILAKVLKARKGGKRFIFYEGPPTANGMPHPGHVMGRCFKDLFLRYKTMQGFYVDRRAGWDTHGLPVEIEIEKKLGFTSKADIEKYGVAEFNRLCKESVWQYKDEWEKVTRRIGFWLDMSDPYITYENDYIETLWWIIKRVFEKGLLVEDYKVMPFCVRCGTGLSSHEIAQGYKTVKDTSAYVKFPVRIARPPEDEFARKAKEGVVFRDGGANVAEYFLVWTTTPWTLPANVALAVNPDVTYVRAKKGEEVVIVAQSRIAVLGEGWEVVGEMKGKELAGMEYRPLFDFVKPPQGARAFYVVEGDFVSATDGSGIVHIAPAYGEDDMRMAKKYQMPILHPVMENGEFVAQVKWKGKFVKNTDKDIIADLEEKKLLFKTEPYEHEYPFCWRCDTPILYYARKGWFIRMSELKKQMQANNKNTNWIPGHIKEGRFGEWLNDVKDWAFSRNRYWGTPLPIWKCQACEHVEVVGSKEELGRQSTLRNRYIIMRHGEAVFNTKNKLDAFGSPQNRLTKKGAAGARASLEQLKKKYPDMRIDHVVASPLVRTQETALIAGDVFGIAEKDIVTDELIRETNFGKFDGKKVRDLEAFFPVLEERFLKSSPDGENLNDLKRRVTLCIKKMEDRYEQKTILVVSHEDPLWVLETALAGLSPSDAAAAKKAKRGKPYIGMGEARFLPFAKLPLDDDGNLDMHKPYIDRISLVCQMCKGVMRRVPEVADVWFDSGSMPLAQAHFPFAQAHGGGTDLKKLVKQIDFPADFICEGVDQTRGWFYTMLAVSTLLDLGNPYKNVIATGHILDKFGKKMSKSKKNYTDPMVMADTYGIDALRWYFFIVNPVGEPKRFDEKDVLVEQRKSVMMLSNIAHFLASYARPSEASAKPPRAKHVLDRWVLSRLAETIGNAGAFLDAYDAQGATRAIASFLDDLSNWYIRRSRDRFSHPENKADYRAAQATLSHVFRQSLKLAAPFMPFVTDHIWRQSKSNKGSVHLERYPAATAKLIDKPLMYAMIKARELVSIALQKRAQAGVKVRQPLETLKIKDADLEPALEALIAEEVNVKEVVADPALAEPVWLDTTITQSLREEGIIREIIRHIQQARKDAGLTQRDAVVISYDASEPLAGVIEAHKAHLLARTIARGAQRKEAGAIKNPREITFDGETIRFAIT